MKNLLITAFLLLGYSFSLTGQADYIQYETHRFKIKRGHEDAFEKGVAAHNKKFHDEDPYKTVIFEMHTGPNSGMYELAMGPMTFTQMEGRPAGDKHDSDWAKVMEHVESTGESEFWRLDTTYAYEPASGTEGFVTNRWRYFTILPGERERFEEQIKKVQAVYTTKQYAASFNVYWKWGASQGPHVCTEIGMKNLAYFDQPNTFEEDFEEIHGEGSFQRLLDDFALCVDRMKTFDEIVQLRMDLSSDF